MDITINDKKATIVLSGRLDTATAPAADEAIKKGLAGADITEVVIDAKELSYISSSGLRIILGLRKQFANTQMLNVQKDVYTVLELTGISKLIKVTCA